MKRVVLALGFAIAFAGVAIALTSPQPAHAGLLTYILSNCAEAGLGPANCPNLDAGTSQLSFRDSVLDVSPDLIVNGFGPGSVANNLFLKQTTGDPGETGLGLNALTPANEIGVGDAIDLNASQIEAVVGGTVTSASVTIGSLQPGETAQVCLLGGIDCQSFTDGVGGLHQFALNPADLKADPVIVVTSLAGDNLVASAVAFETVPEPSTLALLATGLFGLVGAGLMKRRLA